jgi:D-3-phosphoglycerate dehydrogenase
MNNKLVIVTRPIHLDALSRLEAGASVLTPYQATRQELLDMLPRVHGLLLGGSFKMGPLELDLAAKLEVLGRHGVGLDTVDLEAASQRGIPVTFTPDGPTESTAEHALLLILATARRLSQLDRSVRDGKFQIRDQLEVMGHELEGKTLGVVGFGRIGRRVASMCRDALRMSVRVYDPHLAPEIVTGWGAMRVSSLTELVGRVDILSIHVPLTPETHRLIGRDVIRAMKPGSILVNTSRGPVLDEAALVKALEDGHLAGAGLDVYDPQPPAAGGPLLRFDQVVLTPHVASFTHEGRRRMGLTVAEDILRVLGGERPLYLANPEVWPRRRSAS